MQAEPSGKLNLDAMNAERLGSDDRDPHVLKLASAMLCSRPVKPCEAALTMLQIPAVKLSATVHYIASHPPDMRTVSVQHGRMCRTAMENYCRRHPSLEKLTYKEYHLNYICLHMHKEEGLTPTSYTYIGQVGSDHQYQVIKERMVRFTQFHSGNDPEAFCFNVLLDNVPFRDEGKAIHAGDHNKLLANNNGQESYYVECILRGYIEDHEDLEKLVTKHCNDMMYNSFDVHNPVTRLQELRDPCTCLLDALDCTDTTARP